MRPPWGNRPRFIVEFNFLIGFSDLDGLEGSQPPA